MTPAATSKRKTLGRGLSALLGDKQPETTDEQSLSGLKTLPIADLHPCRYQPRRRFADQQIKELAQSVREKGILQPLVVRPDPDQSGSYEIICGERRWRAAQLARLHELPVVVREFTDQETLEIALVENLQREDLTPLEEADAYQRLKDEFGHTQEELADGIGKSRSHVANMIRLLALPDQVKAMLADGRLTAGHARALLTANNATDLAELVVRKGLNVRETEALVAKAGALNVAKLRAKITKDADTLALEHSLTNELGLSAEISKKKKGGVLSLHYQSLDQLDELIHKLTPN
jgi:ParB family transcriptional regulator, chromosome partitioning protein